MTSIELFAGVGGLGMGLHNAGFCPLKVVEWDNHCCKTMRVNKERQVDAIKSWPVFEGDVRLLQFKEFAGKIDLVSGGPPCQPFSLGGKHKAYADTRDMFPEAIRVIRETMPKAFIFENVKGLTRSAFRNYFEYINLQMQHPYLAPKVDEEWQNHLKRLEKHHTSGIRNEPYYNVVSRVLNAANYGVPQKRERVFFVGFRSDLGVEWNFPEETHSLDALVWAQLKDGSYWEHNRIPKKFRQVSSRINERLQTINTIPSTLPWRTVRDTIFDLPDPTITESRTFKVVNHCFQGGAKVYAGHTGSVLDEPAKTLKAGVHGVPGGENMLALQNGAVRYFTVRESARLQTFPDDFIFQGSWSETMRQLGNAVPIKLAESIGRNVASHLKEIS